MNKMESNLFENVQPKTVEDFKIADALDGVEIVYNYSNEDGMTITNPSLDAEDDKKYIREYLTMFNVNPDVIHIESFVDVKLNNNELHIIYHGKINNEIRKMLNEQDTFYNSTVNDKNQIVYIFKL